MTAPHTIPLTAIIPCYNAGDRLRPVVEQVLDVAERVIVVDDGCTDGSMATLEGLTVEIMGFPQNRGKGYALLAGYQAALMEESTQVIATLDADGQHDPAELPRLYEELVEKKADLVIGSRVFTESHVPWASRVGNKLTITITGLLLRHRLPDTQSGYRLFSRQFAQDIVDTVPGGRYETEMEVIVKAVRQGYVTLPVPIATRYETGNASSHFNKLHDSWRIYARLFRAVLRQAKRNHM